MKQSPMEVKRRKMKLKKLLSVLFLIASFLIASAHPFNLNIIPVHAQGSSSYYEKEISAFVWFDRQSTTPLVKGDDAGQWVTLDPS